MCQSENHPDPSSFGVSENHPDPSSSGVSENHPALTQRPLVLVSIPRVSEYHCNACPLLFPEHTTETNGSEYCLQLCRRQLRPKEIRMTEILERMVRTRLFPQTGTFTSRY